MCNFYDSFNYLGCDVSRCTSTHLLIRVFMPNKSFIYLFIIIIYYFSNDTIYSA